MSLLVGGSMIVGYELITFRKSAMQDLSSLAEIIGTASTGAVAFGDTNEANQILESLKDQKSIVSARLFASTGADLATYVRAGVDAALLPQAPQHDRTFVEGNRIKVFRTIRFREDSIGTIYLEADMNRAYNRLYRYAGIVLALIALLVPLVYLLSDRLRRIIAAPIEDLSALAHEIAAEKKYSARAQVRGNDEVGRLTATFNEMLATLEERNQTLVQQAEELWRSNKELEQFAYVSSHDLQEPLRKITTYSQLLEEKFKDNLDPDAKKFIENIGASVLRMRNLITALLTYSRLDRGDRKLETVDLAQILKDVMNDLETAIAEKDAAIVFDPLPTVNWNAFQAQQLFQNLIGNALKFSGKEPPAIYISCSPRGADWLFGVRDNGIGIDKKYSDQIFKVFQRLHPRHIYPGTGNRIGDLQKDHRTTRRKNLGGIRGGKRVHFLFHAARDAA